ncbi:sensor histidine kinase [Ottowia sp. SB7-C50]|uniref:sensor histidine kinase n=1 Tax=Ottowia sp. SB7-C50 TaxID=3081231 RepID=UPI00295365EF|nr:sensor histidine kinase N-terminal domain-containing protein [Ottowia sp. SB7-C50]WOP16404.1 sensor histidine kinase N-terminal domain-containing protein [Ottowia sp. SB7-C50]
MSRPRTRSLRRQLLAGILIPVLLIVAFNTWSLYHQALGALHTAYDRTLLASAKSLGESLQISGEGDAARLQANVPSAALEAFEADLQSRMAYRISTRQGVLLSGYEDLPMWRGEIPVQPPYAALADFYDGQFRGEPVRMAVLLQPVARGAGRDVAVVQVAETLEIRHALARQILWDTLARQAALVALIAATVIAVVQLATRPVRRLSHDLQARPDDDLRPIAAPDAPRELQPLIAATNEHMRRQGDLLAQQQRFVRDASHQLRTPLAVLKAQVQSARRGDVPPAQALAEIEDTVDRATLLANQMLALAKVAQLRQQADAPATAFDDVVRAVALDLAPLIAGQALDFDLRAEPVTLRAHDWMLRELTRNLLHNAIRHTPHGGLLAITLQREGGHARFTVADSGPGVEPDLAARLFQPFSAGAGGTGSGLGLAICHEIVQALGGHIQLRNRVENGRIAGLDAVVTLPIE